MKPEALLNSLSPNNSSRLLDAVPGFGLRVVFQKLVAEVPNKTGIYAEPTEWYDK